MLYSEYLTNEPQDTEQFARIARDKLQIAFTLARRNRKERANYQPAHVGHL